MRFTFRHPDIRISETHSSRVSRLEPGAFYCAACSDVFLRFHRFNGRRKTSIYEVILIPRAFEALYSEIFLYHPKRRGWGATECQS